MRWIALFVVVLTCSRFAFALDIPLTIEEPAGVPRKAGEVSSGVPLPAKTYKPDQRFSLFEGNNEIPLQTTPLVVDRDGYLRWVLLDFQTDVDASGKKSLVLRDKPGTMSSARSIMVREDAYAVVVDTGAVEFSVSKTKPFTVFDGVTVDKQLVVEGGVVQYIDAQTKQVYNAARPDSVTFEYRGPQRTTIKIEGVYDGPGETKLRYITRITAWAGKKAVRVQHTLANSNNKQVFHANVSSATLALNHTLGEADAALGTGDVKTRLAGDTAAWIHQGKLRVQGRRRQRQIVEDAAKAGIGADVKWTGTDSDGWLSLQKGDSRLTIVDRDFRGDPPRKLSANSKQLVLDYVSNKFEGPGAPFVTDNYWLYDLSHKVADAWLDFGGDQQVIHAARSPLMAMAPGDWYSQCDVIGVGPFGTLDDEKKSYEQWGWTYDAKQIPHRAHDPHQFVPWEDNHYTSETDSPEGLALMWLRTGQRGFFDQAMAWGKYHANMHAWRTDGWVYSDGAIWFPQGGPLGSLRERKGDNFVYNSRGKGQRPEDKELFRQSQAKACYCHFYGAGLVDLYCLTGERDMLEAAVDLAEQKNSEVREHHRYKPGTTTIHDTRGFGRGFYVVVRVLEVVPDNELLRDLARLYRDVLWRNPEMDERGFAPAGTAKTKPINFEKNIGPGMRAYMEKNGISIDEDGQLTDGKQIWHVTSLGGTWQHYYLSTAAERYARITGDEDMADFTEGFGRFTAKFMLSDKCHQTWYYANADVPVKGQMWDPWKFEEPHVHTTDGNGCQHDGYYTRHFPGVVAMAYSFTGDAKLMDRAKEFWSHGSRREYQAHNPKSPEGTVGEFATNDPSQNDSAMSTARLFYEAAHPRKDKEAPAAVNDLQVTIENGQTRVQFTAPADRGDGKVTRYQVKCAEMPIVSYDAYDFARDDGQKRNAWRAMNLTGEPAPKPAGERETFAVQGVPAVPTLHFVVISYDDSNNQSGLSNVVAVQQAP